MADGRSRAAAAAAGTRVLVAEDNPVNQLVIQGMLDKRGYEIDVAADGREALEPGSSAASTRPC